MGNLDITKFKPMISRNRRPRKKALLS